MGQTVKELLFDAIHYDESFLAHSIYYAVQQKLVKLEDPADLIPYDELDYPTILKMRDDNALLMCQVKLFTIPVSANTFSLYLAMNENEAHIEHLRTYGKRSNQIFDLTDKMDTVTYCETTKKLESFRELKRQVIKFPYFAGEMAGRGN